MFSGFFYAMIITILSKGIKQAFGEPQIPNIKQKLTMGQFSVQNLRVTGNS